MPVLEGVTHRYVDVGGLRVHVAEAGQGEPLVLLHGWPQHWWCWRQVVPLLQDRYRLVMPDLRGHGWTDAPPDGYDKEQLATDLLGPARRARAAAGRARRPRLGRLDRASSPRCARPSASARFLALGIVHPFQRPTLGRALQSWRLAYQVGLSTPLLAEAAAAQLAARSSSRSSRAGSHPARGLRRRAGADVRRGAAGPGAGAGERAALPLDGPARGAAGRARALPRPRRCAVPTRLVVGDGDPVAGPALLEGAPADLEVEVLPGVGHFVPEEAPEASPSGCARCSADRPARVPRMTRRRGGDLAAGAAGAARR